MCLEFSKKETGTAPSVTTTVQTLKVGDSVQVTGKAASYSNGWKNSWVSQMDAVVGKVGKITNIDTFGKTGVQLDISGAQGFRFPESVLKSVNPAPQVVTPLNAESKFGFTVGQRVETKPGYSTNGPGTIVSFDTAFVQVKHDSTGVRSWYPTNLVPVKTATPVPSGLTKYAASISTSLATAKTIAVKLAQTNGYPYETNSDQVQAELQKQGLSALGNSAGQLFKQGFQNTGKTVKSTRAGNRGRRIIVWRYTGSGVAEPPAPTPTTPTEYVIEYSWTGPNGKFQRSGNAKTSGVFTNLSVAQSAAAAEQSRMGGSYVYKVVPKQ